MSDSQKIARAVVEKIRSDRASRGTIMAQWMVDEWVSLVTPVIEEALLPLRGENADLLARLDAAAFGATQVQAEIEERQRAFDLRWEADQRAIKRWHDAGNPPLVWPDHADLCVWLLGESERLTQRVRELETGLRDTLATRGRPQRDEHLSNVAFQAALEADREARSLLSQPPAPQPFMTQRPDPETGEPLTVYAPAPQPSEPHVPLTPCCVCGDPVCTYEYGECPEGREDHKNGVELTDGRWSCSQPCFDKAAEPSEPARPATRCDVTDLDGFPCDAKTCNLHPEGR